MAAGISCHCFDSGQDWADNTVLDRLGRPAGRVHWAEAALAAHRSQFERSCSYREEEARSTDFATSIREDDKPTENVGYMAIRRAEFSAPV